MNVPEGLIVNSYPGSYGQVLTNLFLNAVNHAFADGKGGTIRFEDPPEGGFRVVVTSGSAWVSGDAQVSGSADLRQRRHVLTVGPVGSKGRTVTIHRHYDGPESTHWGNLVNAGCWSGTLDALAARIAGDEHGWSDEDTGRYRADYEAVMFLARPRVAEWAAEPLTAADHARWAVVSA